MSPSRALAALLLLGCQGADRDQPPPRPTTASTLSNSDSSPSLSDSSTTDTWSSDTGSSATSPLLDPSSPPELSIPPAGSTVPLARELSVHTLEPTTLVVHIDDGERLLSVAFPDQATAHQVPLLGLPADSEVAIEAELFDEAGTSHVVDLGTVTTDSLPEPFPDFEPLTHAPALMEPGYTFGSVGSPMDGVGYLLALDDRLRVVWLWDGDGQFYDVRIHSDGTIFADHDDTPSRWTLLGEELTRWSPDTTRGAHVVPTPYHQTHHEVYPLDDGSFWTLCYGSTEVPDLPRSEGKPDELGGPAMVEDNCVAHVAADGTVLAEWWATDLLDTERISFDSLKSTPRGADWAHLNGLVPAADGAVIVSARHQDAVFKVDASGQLEWILGDHAGWRPEFAPYLLEPVGELSWPYHQHAPALATDGTLWLHDNHNHGRTPYTPASEAEPQVTRLVGYRIDEEAMTVEQVASYGSEVANGPLFNPARGDADPLPTTAHVFGTWSAVEREATGTNAARGLGDHAVRLVEVDPTTKEVALDLRVQSERSEWRSGWIMYRAEREPSLYPPDVSVTVTDH